MTSRGMCRKYIVPPPCIMWKVRGRMWSKKMKTFTVRIKRMQRLHIKWNLLKIEWMKIEDIGWTNFRALCSKHYTNAPPLNQLTFSPTYHLPRALWPTSAENAIQERHVSLCITITFKWAWFLMVKRWSKSLGRMMRFPFGKNIKAIIGKHLMLESRFLEYSSTIETRWIHGALGWINVENFTFPHCYHYLWFVNSPLRH